MVIDTTYEIKAIARYIRTSPFKVRRVLDQIRGKSYQEALILLEFMPYRACEPIVKVLRSAVANAEHNAGLDKSKLVVSQAYADQGQSSNALDHALKVAPTKSASQLATLR